MVGNPLHAARESGVRGAKSPTLGGLASISNPLHAKSPKRGGLASTGSASEMDPKSPKRRGVAASPALGSATAPPALDGAAASVGNPLLEAAAAAAVVAVAATDAAVEAAVAAAPEPPPGWVKKWSSSKERVFYVSVDTGAKSWKLPAAEAPAADVAAGAAGGGGGGAAPAPASPQQRPLFSRARSASKLAPKEWAVLNAARQSGRLKVASDPLTGLPPGWAKEFGGDGEARFVNAGTGQAADSVDGILKVMGASALQAMPGGAEEAAE